jgi:hypothetical protein
MRPIEKLMTARLAWELSGSEWTSTFLGYDCRLQMNDFPDEPLFTLSWRGDTIDFDDKPTCWILPLVR